MDKVYIFDLEKAYFYIEQGVRPIEPPKEHYRTHKICFCFRKSETEELYKNWLERKR